GGPARGNGSHGHTRFTTSPRRIETRYTSGGRATTTTPPSGTVLTAEPPPVTALPRARRGRTRSRAWRRRDSACDSRPHPQPPPARDRVRRESPRGAGDRGRRS